MLSLPFFDVVCTSLFVWLGNEQERHEQEHDTDKILLCCVVLCCVVLCCVVLRTLGPADRPLRGTRRPLRGARFLNWNRIK